MSNEQLMQEELKKAMGSVNEVATDELSDEELEAVAGGSLRRPPRRPNPFLKPIIKTQPLPEPPPPPGDNRI